METASRVFVALVGEETDSSLEHRLFNAISLVNGVANIVGSLIYLMHLDNVLFLVQFLTGVLFVVFYYFSRFRHHSRQVLFWPFVLLILAFLFYNILRNNGTMGGAHYYLIPGLVIAAALSGEAKRTIAAVLLFNVTSAVLLLVEMYYPEWITVPTGTHDRIVDVTQNLLFAQILTGAVVLLLSQTLNQERAKTEALLLNILPQRIANELKRSDRVPPRNYESASVLFTDFVGFTKIAEHLSPQDLIGELDFCFRHFDEITKRHGLEKIKTIGDSYMAAGGLPEPNRTHPVDCVRAAFEIQSFMEQTTKNRVSSGRPYWELRLGINSGPLVAGVIGQEKFAYDVWGDTVNTASRLESSGVPGRVNISEGTYNLVKDFFVCEYRGKIEAKNKGPLNMYFANRIQPELAVDADGRIPNEKFFELYRKLRNQTHESPAPRDMAQGS